MEAPLCGDGMKESWLGCAVRGGMEPSPKSTAESTLLHSHTGGPGLPVGNEGLDWAFHHSLPLQILPAPAQVRQISINTYVSLTSTHISDFSCVISLEKGHVYVI